VGKVTIECVRIGAAWLVKHLADGKMYVAKKIILDGMSTKEQEGCMQEVNLLRNLNHPNIVAYRDSFFDKGLLIIIMEYCEVGDLSFQI